MALWRRPFRSGAGGLLERMRLAYMKEVELLSAKSDYRRRAAKSIPYFDLPKPNKTYQLKMKP